MKKGFLLQLIRKVFDFISFLMKGKSAADKEKYDKITGNIEKEHQKIDDKKDEKKDEKIKDRLDGMF